jgi:hypothetical protein
MLARKKEISEAKCIQSKKTCYEAAIESEAKPTLYQEEKEQAEERGKPTQPNTKPRSKAVLRQAEKEHEEERERERNERDQRSRM